MLGSGRISVGLSTDTELRVNFEIKQSKNKMLQNDKKKVNVTHPVRFLSHKTRLNQLDGMSWSTAA